MPGVSDDLWWAMPVLAGRLIRLEPLALEHAPGYLAAAGHGEQGAEVFRWLSPPGGALAQPVRGPGTSPTPGRPGPGPYAQIDAAPGVRGTTSFYEVTPRCGRWASGTRLGSAGGAPGTTPSRSC